MICNFNVVFMTDFYHLCSLYQRQIKQLDAHLTFSLLQDFFNFPYPLASEASREVANLTERKKSAYPCKWCQRICLSVCYIFFVGQLREDAPTEGHPGNLTILLS